MTSKVYSNIEATIQDFLVSYEDAVKSKDAHHLSRTLAPECRRYISPASFPKSQGMPAGISMTNDEYESFAGPKVISTESFRYETYNTIIDVAKLKAVAHVVQHNAVAETSFDMEQVWFFDFVEDGTKIREVREFMDTAEVAKMMVAYGGA